MGATPPCNVPLLKVDECVSPIRALSHQWLLVQSDSRPTTAELHYAIGTRWTLEGCNVYPIKALESVQQVLPSPNSMHFDLIKVHIVCDHVHNVLGRRVIH